MTAASPPTDGPTTDGEFNDQLGELIRNAHANDVDVAGGYAFRHDGDNDPDWGVEIYEVTKSRPAIDVG